MRKRSWESVLALRKERVTAKAEARRRLLRECYPAIPPQAWANMADGLYGDGMRAVREWLASVDELTVK